MATIRDVAREAGVSVTTVSAAINGTAPVSEKARARVWSAVEAVGYSPNRAAQNLRSGRSTTIGLVIPDISTPYFAHLAKALHQALSPRGYQLFLSSNNDDPDTEIRDIETFTAHRVAGLLAAPTSQRPDDSQRLAEAIRVPAVFLDRVVPGAPFATVADDNQLGAQLIARYLLHLGHRDIAFLAGRSNISPSDERLAGFVETMTAAGVTPRDDLVLRGVHTYDLALQAVQQLMLQPNPPSALVSINNAQTSGIMAALKHMGLRAPKDVSVITFDGLHGSEGWDPVLTAISQDIGALSRVAAGLLLAQIDGTAMDDAVGKIVRIAPILEIGDSCRRAGPPLIGDVPPEVAGAD